MAIQLTRSNSISPEYFSWNAEDWNRNVQEVIEAQTFNPQQLIDALSQDILLKKCYEKDAGVGEQFTIGEHTQFVLETAQRYRNTFEATVTKTVPWNHFLLFLALHDIGKGIAAENKGTKLHFVFKEDELFQTQRFLKDIMKDLGISDSEIAIFSSMLLYDTQGSYLKNEIDKSAAFNNILEMARNCEMAPDAFYELFSAFHAIDAASYPFLFQRIFQEENGNLIHINENKIKIDALAQQLRKSVRGESVFQELMNALSSDMDPKSLRKHFISNRKELTLFLQRMNIEMLSQTSDNSPNKEKYQKIQKGLSLLYEHFNRELDAVSEEETLRSRWRAQQPGYSPPSEKRSEILYKAVISNVLGFSLPNVWVDLRLAFFNDRLIKEDASDQSQIGLLLGSIEDLILESLEFHRNYCCRYEKESLKKYVAKSIRDFSVNQNSSLQQSINALEKKLERMPFTDTNRIDLLKRMKTLLTTDIDELLSLLDLTFFHGTNTDIWPYLQSTNLRLVPTGVLRKEKILPPRGEQGKGYNQNGVNEFSLSGAPIDWADRAISYAKLPKFDIFKEKKEIIDWLNSPLPGIQITSQTAYQKRQFIIDLYIPVTMAAKIARLKASDPKNFELLKEQLEAKTSLLKELLSLLKKDPYICSLLPRSKDPTGELGYTHGDNYLWDKFTPNENVLQSIEEVLNQDQLIFKPSDQQGYPIVFASNTLHATSTGSSEKALSIFAQVGHDIRTIFVPQENKEDIQQKLSTELLERSVSVFSFETLENVVLINMIASRYLVDIASRFKNG